MPQHRRIVIGVLWCSLLLVGGACQQHPTTPEPREPGRRDYVWTVDTLAAEMNYIRDVWGATPADVWAVGPAGTYRNRLWHSDGTAWTAYTQEEIWCGGKTLHGFSADNIWMGGQAGWFSEGAGIWHYDGVTWEEQAVYNVEGAYSVHIWSIHGRTPDDIYACGMFSYVQEPRNSTYRGFILHYDGNTWEEVYRATWESQFLEVLQAENRVYIDALEHWDTNTFYELQGSRLDTVHSRRGRNGVMNLIDEAVYFTMRHGVYRNKNGTFQRIRAFDMANFGYQVYGRHPTDLFLRMLDGVAHYNGTDTQQLYTYPDQAEARIINEPLILERDIFFILNDHTLGPRYSNMIRHGTLKPAED